MNSVAPTLYTETVGVGPDVVLVHGWGMHSGVWTDVVIALRERYRVTVLDLPGHGYSQPSASGHDLHDLTSALLAVAPATATWVGWSLGGLAVQQLALVAPERVERMVLTNSTPCFVQRPDWPHAVAEPLLRRFAEELRQDYRAVLKRFIALEVHGSEHAGSQLHRLKAMLFQHGQPDVAALEDGLTILETCDLRSELPRIACPTLLLMGQRDQLVPAAAGEAMQDLLPDARLHIFPRAGHAPFFSHLPEYMAELQAFLDE